MKDYNELVDALHKGVKNTDMIDLLTTHHSQLNIMDRKIQSQMESATLYSQVFGLRPITHEDHQSLFKSTGIDVDNRKEVCGYSFPLSNEYNVFILI
ncbi:hypothetical protein EB796_011086 [Bugula neritina]|uniref:Uncharacterized protein n=1 Tax=Bugula neritina TaxID=10212 RepID=A0A7J7JXZ8_BUGNE|nr:hypothetical protein EB796_011086 [Bugula neritina]